MKDYIISQLSESSSLVSDMLNNKVLIDSLEKAARACIYCLDAGGKILLAGNGGSAADAQHIAAELVNKFAFDRLGLPAIALTTDSSVITSISNDDDFSSIFNRQLKTLAKEGDVFIGYSTSGLSSNVINAFQVARMIGVTTIGLTGNKEGPMKVLCNHLLEVSSSDTPKIQEGHLIIGHILCGLIENTIFGDKR